MTVLEALAGVDARDAYTAGHSRRVHGLAIAIGEELGIAAGALAGLAEAALFHDVGKAVVPDEILLKPARLTEDEWAVVHRHSEEGARIASEAGMAADAAPAIRHHHENFDGSGYPAGLRGEAIPLAARVIHVADALDSMLSTRVYRAGRPVREALAELRREAGRQFCPRCVAAVERLVARGALDELGVPAGLWSPPFPSRARGRAPASGRARKRVRQLAGRMFWLTRKRFCGSYSPFTRASRS